MVTFATRYRGLILTGVAFSILFAGFAVVFLQKNRGCKVAPGVITNVSRINRSQFVDVNYEVDGKTISLHTLVADRSTHHVGNRVFVKYSITNPGEAALFPFSQTWMQGIAIWAIGTAAVAFVIAATIHELKKES